MMGIVRSEPMDHLVRESRTLEAQGAKEINHVA